MTQNELNRHVAKATFETTTVISRRGFSELNSLPAEPDAEDLILDWDLLQAERNTAFFRQPEPLAVTFGRLMPRVG